MNTTWHLPAGIRLRKFVERWRELDQWTDPRKLSEQEEMLEIADAILSQVLDRLDRLGCAARAAYISLQQSNQPPAILIRDVAKKLEAVEKATRIGP